MAKTRKAFVHIGLDDGSADVVERALEKHRRALLELGVHAPAKTREEMFRAAVEVMRTHRAWGFERREVRGAWAQVHRRTDKGKGRVVVSQAQLAAASPEQAALLVDGLAGHEVHVVVTVRAPGAFTTPGEPAEDLASVLGRWRRAVRRPEHLHVIVAGDPASTWKAFGRVVGFGTASLGVADLPEPVRHHTGELATPLMTASRLEVLRQLGRTWAELLADTEHDVIGDPRLLVPGPAAPGSGAAAPGTPTTELALAQALRQVERLTRRNESLELRLTALERKRRKRRLTEVA